MVWRVAGAVMAVGWSGAASAEPVAGLIEPAWLIGPLLLLVVTFLIWNRRLRREVVQRRAAEQALRRYRQVVSATQDSISLIDRNAVYLLVNESYLRIFERRYDEIVGHSARELLGDEAFERVVAPRLTRCLAGETVNYQAWFDLPGTGRCYLDVLYAPYRDQGVEIDGVLVSVRDITERRRAEEARQLAANVFTHAREGIVITDPRGDIVDLNAAFLEITGQSRETLLGSRAAVLSRATGTDQIFSTTEGDVWTALDEQGHWEGELSGQRRGGGETYVAMVTVTTMRDDDGKVQHYVVLYHDITALKLQQRRLEQAAHYDGLTGLPNRVLLFDRLEQAMSQVQRRGGALAVVYFDLDGFKAVNDGLGHEAGDHLLAGLATRMRGVLREGDTIARLGGDEFVAVLLDPGGVAELAPLLDRLLEALSRPMPIAGHLAQVSASLGVSCFDQGDTTTSDLLLRRADQAMYQAKLAGKGRYRFFTPGVDDAPRRHSLAG
ncbi:diguanylate cyclase [Marichromatium purpuratum 984]|uniref:Diguanylate cyclase n=1 Tax=Marichromatium purpuratum 984 TaxID=765910 RepID=W0E2T3_MARPU|nr:diguanylate cyclase [Marichromatium purpuratum 984]